MRAKRVDSNHGQIRDYLRSTGWSVFDSSAVGRGFPDFVVARRGFTALVECKDGAKPPSARRLTDAQERFWKEWPGVRILATSPEDAEKQLNLAESYYYIRLRQVEALR